MRYLYRLCGVTSVIAVAMTGLVGCGGVPNQQNPLSARISNRADLLPEASSITSAYVPSPLGKSPNAAAAYHVTPVVSYEDRSLSENLAGAIELSDYREAARRAGYWPYFNGGSSYTVLAIPNGPFEKYRRQWERDILTTQKRKRLVGLIGQTILKGSWDLAKIRRRAAVNGGVVHVPTLAGKGHDVMLRPMEDGVQVIAHSGAVLLRGGNYRQSNGVLYVTDSVLLYR